MVTAAIILGWIGIFIYITVIFTVQKLMKENEFGFIHTKRKMVSGRIHLYFRRKNPDNHRDIMEMKKGCQSLWISALTVF
jgi:ribosomal protein L33